MMQAFSNRFLGYLPRCFPRGFWHYYGYLARKQGLQRLYLILSFDCDTPEDITAAQEIGPWLNKRGIKATYAVPGQQLGQGATVYRQLAEAGAEFINHGALPHAAWRDNRYWSITFYHEMSVREVSEDIRRGHDIVTRVIGRPPDGFRAPHFGLFQAPQQLRLLHETLQALGYRYSTSTTPAVALRHGPVWYTDGLCEVPLCGSYRSFLNILDSWGHISTPYYPVVQDRYAALFIQTIDRLLALGIPGVLNYYVDPAHVYRSQAFFRALEYSIERDIPTLHYRELLDLVACEDKNQ